MYQNFSFEELRLANESWGDGGAIGGRIPAERLIVRPQPDGSYTATWTPRVAGSYICHCTLDDQPTLQVRNQTQIGDFCVNIKVNSC